MSFGVQRRNRTGQVIAKNQVQSTHTLNLKVKSTSLLKKKVDVTLHFNNHVHNSTFRTTDVTGSIELPAGTEMVMPGDNVTIDAELIHPIAVEQGTYILFIRRVDVPLVQVLQKSKLSLRLLPEEQLFKSDTKRILPCKVLFSFSFTI